MYTDQEKLFQPRFSTFLNSKSPLLLLARLINWSGIAATFDDQFKVGPGQPPLPIRLVIGLFILQYIYGISDEQVVSYWLENPYWQHFCGYDHLQFNHPCDLSSLTRWRKRLGPSGLDKVLSHTIALAVRTKTIQKKQIYQPLCIPGLWRA